ncbi:MAG TPA: LysE family translocator [Lichenihabitans sp.]|jgi:threonine/homoserine/homoserine lactone efflux protein|nr:LysE family translocator [Lichenihabitans sp.]
MSVSGLMVFALALMVAAGSPGPSIAALVARVMSRGLRDVLPFLLAMWFGETLWITAAVAGLTALAAAFQPIFVAIKFAGVAYLLVLAWSMWFAPTEAAATETLPTGQRPWRMFVAGLLVTLGNPKIMIFYLALLPTLVDLGQVDILGWAELCATAVLVLAVVDLGWAIAASRARALLRSRRALKIANRTGASVMAGAALAIATR